MKAVLCVDVEPDSRTPDPALGVGWIGAERLLGDPEWLRSRLGGQAINWYVRFDHQVEYLHGDICWAAEHFAGHLDDMVDGGDEIGVHPHYWRWTGEGWLADGTSSWVIENAERALDAYASMFGTGPRSFRYGDRFVSDEVVQMLLAHPDVVVDLTTEPGVPACRGLVATEQATGITRHIDVGLARRYRPDLGAVDIPAASGELTMVPLTTAVRPDTGRIDTLALWKPPEEFEQMLGLRLLDSGLDHLAFAIRSDIALMPWAIERVEQNLDTVSRATEDLEWVAASSLALAPGDPGDQGLGLVGSLAVVIDEVIVALDPGAPVPTAPIADAVRVLKSRTNELIESNATISSRLDDTERRLAEVQRALADEKARVVDRDAALAAKGIAADSLAERLAAIESTTIWRARAALLPVLRPIARARRAALGRWSRIRRARTD